MLKLSPNSLPLSHARASRKHVNDDLGGDEPLQPSPGRGQHEGHPLGFETSRSHKEGNACLSQTPGGGGGGVVVVVVVEWFYYSKRIIIVRWADLSDFLFR